MRSFRGALALLAAAAAAGGVAAHGHLSTTFLQNHGHDGASSGSGTAADPFIIAEGWTNNLNVVTDSSVYLRLQPPTTEAARFVIYPCFGRFNYYAKAGGTPTSSNYDQAQIWPSDPTEHHGNHVWEEHDFGNAAFVDILVQGTMPDGDSVPKVNGVVQSNFTMDVAFGSDAMFVVPQEGNFTATALANSAGARLTFPTTGTTGDLYNVFFHEGKNGDGTMAAGMIMGTTCGIQAVDRRHAAMSHMRALRSAPAAGRALSIGEPAGIEQYLDSWMTSDADAAEVTVRNLDANSEYHFDVVILRNTSGNVQYRAYHSEVVFTNGAGATGASLLLAALLTLWAVQRE